MHTHSDGFIWWKWHRKTLKRDGMGDGVAICKAEFGQGQERVVFRLVELQNNCRMS